jgi:hypothetical protein
MSFITIIKAAVTTVAVGLMFFLATNAQAVTVNFAGGGTCDIIVQANGIRLDKCVNTSGKTANDIHLTFTHAKLTTVTKDYENGFGCGFFTVCQFGANVTNGGTWEGVSGSTALVNNPTIWRPVDLAGKVIILKKVVVGGYWTFNGAKIAPVPLPATFPLLAVGLGGLFLFSRRRNLGRRSRERSS